MKQKSTTHEPHSGHCNIGLYNNKGTSKCFFLGFALGLNDKIFLFAFFFKSVLDAFASGLLVIVFMKFVFPNRPIDITTSMPSQTLKHKAEVYFVLYCGVLRNGNLQILEIATS